jgi:aminoglycoside phosphotransferase (APT) family kinase protein
MQVSTPALYGMFADTTSDQIWLILEYLDESMRVKKSDDPAAMALAARWIGEFHAASQLLLQRTATPFLKPYDAEYYLGWAQRTLQYADRLRWRLPWLTRLCERFDKVATTLLAVTPTVIHGEYYPKNILYRDGKVHPVDWESATIAAGEIDLASLTEGWADEVAHGCKLQYQTARWPDGSPGDFERTLCAAQIYLHFRWLGDLSAAAVTDWRIDQLHSAGRRFGVI